MSGKRENGKVEAKVERQTSGRKAKLLTGPTILTLVRVVIVIPLVVFMMSEGAAAKILAVVCFIVGAVTDFIDGRWARGAGLVTDLGTFLDPLADKMLVNLTFLVLVYQNIIPLPIFSIILVRDFAVDGMRMMVAKTGVTVAASIFGKAKTMLQMITLTLFLINVPVQNNILLNLNNILLGFVIILTVYSGMDYLVKGWRIIKAKQK